MHSKICKLPEAVINKIAAGEVVENPGSIVKELIENSVDASAKKIEISFVQGGLESLIVVDDGCGMHREDARLCIERHATSKIRSEEDLERLQTMGFRGEALAAISAVSFFELTTSDGISGTKIVVEGGVVQAIEPCVRNRGTTIEVRTLFFNVPARKKFQKSVAANSAQIRKIVETIALAHPDIHIVLKNNGQFLLDLPKQAKRERIEAVLGKWEHQVEYQKGTIAIYGMVRKPSEAGSRNEQFVYINRRPVFSPLIRKAVKTAYGTRIQEQLYPPFILYLDIPPHDVDVNVHPQKKEVRFRNESEIFQKIEEAVTAVFASPAPFSHSISFSEPTRSESISYEPRFSLAEEPVELDFIFQERGIAIIGHYLFVESNGFYLIDLKAAHARVLFERQGESKPLLRPLQIECTEKEEWDLAALGIEWRMLHNRLIVDALPPFLETDHFALFFTCLQEHKKMEKAVVRFCQVLKKRYTITEALLLWSHVKKCRDCTYDPAGNLIATAINEEVLKKIFRS